MMNLRPMDQIVLLAGLAGDDVRERIWAYPELRNSIDRLADAGLVAVGSAAEGPDGLAETACHSGLSEPAGFAAARGLRHITLNDLLAEHLPERA